MVILYITSSTSGIWYSPTIQPFRAFSYSGVKHIHHTYSSYKKSPWSLQQSRRNHKLKSVRYASHYYLTCAHHFEVLLLAAELTIRLCVTSMFTFFTDKHPFWKQCYLFVVSIWQHYTTTQHRTFQCFHPLFTAGRKHFIYLVWTCFSAVSQNSYYLWHMHSPLNVN